VSYQSDAFYGPGDPGGSLPYSMLNSDAQQPGDIFLTGIAGAAINAINMATGAQPTAVQTLQYNQANSMQLLLVVGIVVWLMAGKKS
jgi:hypothetical protein